MQSYQSAAAAVVERHDGHIAQRLGDGVVVYFGYPLAHEDDAARAVIEKILAHLGLSVDLPTPVPARSTEWFPGWSD